MTTSNESRRATWGPIVVTGLVAFATSLLWYSPVLFGPIWMRFRTGGPDVAPGWTMLLAPLREIVAASALAWLLARLSIRRWTDAVAMALGAWVAFHAVGMTGAVLWDHMPWQLAAVHGGDWLVKLVLMSMLLTAWNRRSARKAPLAS